MDHYADDLAALTAHLDLKDAVHVGHSTGGGEVVHYLGRHGHNFARDFGERFVPGYAESVIVADLFWRDSTLIQPHTMA